MGPRLIASLSTLFASNSFRSTDVFWRFPPGMARVALIRCASWSGADPSAGASRLARAQCLTIDVPRAGPRGTSPAPPSRGPSEARERACTRERRGSGGGGGGASPSPWPA